MKIRSLVASAAVVAMGAGGLFAAAPAHAAGDTAVTFTLTGGTLSIDVASATKPRQRSTRSGRSSGNAEVIAATPAEIDTATVRM